jgi:hypothetical protein
MTIFDDGYAPLSNHTLGAGLNDINLAVHAPYNFPRAVYYIEFYQSDVNNPYIAVGEIELLGAIGFNESLAYIKQ